jgi:hypothetical protein
VIFGVASNDVARVERRFRFEQLDAERTNCFAVWTRLEIVRPAGVSAMQYYAFRTPPGVYELINDVDGRYIAFTARAGEVLYVGDYTLGENSTSRALDTATAALFARSLGLSAPTNADITYANQPETGQPRYCTI